MHRHHALALFAGTVASRRALAQDTLLRSVVAAPPGGITGSFAGLLRSHRISAERGPEG